MSRRIIHALIAFSFFWGVTLKAQLGQADDHLGSDFLRPQIVAGYSATSARLFQDVDGAYSATSFSLQATIPVYRDFSTQPDPSTSYLVLVKGQLTSLYPEISFVPYSRSLYLSTVGLTGGIRTPSGHRYLLTVNAGIAEDDKTIGKPKVRPTGSLVGKYQLDNSFSFIYGLSYSYTFNRGLVLPLLGADCRLTRNVEMHLVLPFSLEINYRDVDALQFGFVARANGNQIHINDDSYSGPQSLPMYLKYSQVQVGFSVSLGLSQHLWLCGEAGMSRDRTLAMGTLDHDFINTKVENGGYSILILKCVIDGSDEWLW